MKTKKSKRPRSWKLTRPWSEQEIDGLIKCKLLEFLPEPEIPLKVGSPDQGPADGFADMLKHVKPETRRLLDAELDVLRRQHLSDTTLRRHLWRIVGRCLSREHELAEEGASFAYLSRRLGIDPLSNEFHTVHAGKWTPKDEARRTLSEQTQHKCFREWVEIPKSLWQNVTWRECIFLHYGLPNTPLLKALTPPTREILNREADRLKADASWSTPSASETFKIIDNLPECRHMGNVWKLLANTYLRLRLLGDETEASLLLRPLEDSWLFSQMADSGELNPKRARDFNKKDFLKYLSVPAGGKDHLVGEVVYYLLRLEEVSGTPSLPPIMSSLNQLWPPIVTSRLRNPPGVCQ